MQIIEVGKTFAERLIGRRCTCTQCGTVAAVEAADVVRVRLHESNRARVYHLPWTCPHCGATMVSYFDA